MKFSDFQYCTYFLRVCTSGRILWVSEDSRVSWSYAKGNKGGSLETTPARHTGIFYLSEIYLHFTKFSPPVDGELQRTWLPKQRVVQRHTVCKKRLSQKFTNSKCPISFTAKLFPELIGQCPGDLWSIQGLKSWAFIPVESPANRKTVKRKDFLTVHKVDV